MLVILSVLPGELDAVVISRLASSLRLLGVANVVSKFCWHEIITRWWRWTSLAVTQVRIHGGEEFRVTHLSLFHSYRYHELGIERWSWAREKIPKRHLEVQKMYRKRRHENTEKLWLGIWGWVKDQILKKWTMRSNGLKSKNGHISSVRFFFAYPITYS